MSASEKLKARKMAHTDAGLKVLPIFRKTGPVVEGADAFSRARDVESIMDALPQIVAVVEAAERIEDDRRRHLMTPFTKTDALLAALTALDEALA